MDFGSKMGLIHIFSNQFGMLGLAETWKTLDKLYGLLFFFFLLRFKTSPQLLRLFGNCFAVKPPKCFVEYETDFLSAWVGVDD